MSERVEVRIQKQLDGESIDNGAIVEVRAVGEKGRSRFVQRVGVPVGENPARARGLDLEPGRYEFSATLPSGSIVSQIVDVGATPGPVHVALDAGASPHEWLAWQQWSGNASEQAIQGVR